jgi:hypothetical protein
MVVNENTIEINVNIFCEFAIYKTLSSASSDVYNPVLCWIFYNIDVYEKKPWMVIRVFLIFFSLRH